MPLVEKHFGDSSILNQQPVVQLSAEPSWRPVGTSRPCRKRVFVRICPDHKFVMPKGAPRNETIPLTYIHTFGKQPLSCLLVFVALAGIGGSLPPSPKGFGRTPVTSLRLKQFKFSNCVSDYLHDPVGNGVTRIHLVVSPRETLEGPLRRPWYARAAIARPAGFWFDGKSRSPWSGASVWVP
jgi:hypothetical protein